MLFFRQRDLLWLGRETDEAQAQGHPAKQQPRVRMGLAPAVRPTRHEEEATRPPSGQSSQDPHPSPSPSPSSFPCAKSQWPTTKAQRQITKPQWRSCKGHPSPAHARPRAPRRTETSRSCSSGDARGSVVSTRANSLSAALAFFVVAKEANVETLVWLRAATPANIVVVSYDVWLDEGLEVAPALHKAVEQLNSKEDCWKAVWTKFGAVLGKTSRVAGVDWEMKIDKCPHILLCCEVRIRSSKLSS